LHLISDRFSSPWECQTCFGNAPCARSLMQKVSRARTHSENCSKKEKGQFFFCITNFVLKQKMIATPLFCFFHCFCGFIIAFSFSRECHLSLLVFRQCTMGALCLFIDEFSAEFFSQQIAQNEKCFSSYLERAANETDVIQFLCYTASMILFAASLCRAVILWFADVIYIMESIAGSRQFFCNLKLR
jgi:hypothetical protein